MDLLARTDEVVLTQTNSSLPAGGGGIGKLAILIRTHKSPDDGGGERARKFYGIFEECNMLSVSPITKLSDLR